MDIKWYGWKDGFDASGQKQIYGEGPFILLDETGEMYTVILPMQIPRMWLEEANICAPLFVKSILDAIGEKKRSCKCSHADEPHPLSALRVVYDEKYVSESPFTSGFRMGQSVSTPQGPGTVEKITWRQVQVDGILYDAQHVTSID